MTLQWFDSSMINNLEPFYITKLILQNGRDDGCTLHSLDNLGPY